MKFMNIPLNFRAIEEVFSGRLQRQILDAGSVQFLSGF
jgi:hypothetical protein